MERKTYVTEVDRQQSTITFDTLPPDISATDYFEETSAGIRLVQGPKMEIRPVHEHWLKTFLLKPVRWWNGYRVRKAFERAMREVMRPKG